MTHTRIRSLCLALCLLILTLSLTACYTITLKERRVDGMGSAISLKLPGNLQKLDFPVPVDPLTQRYFEGSRLYGEMDGGLYIAIYTNSIDTQQMYDDLHISQGQAISQRRIIENRRPERLGQPGHDDGQRPARRRPDLYLHVSG